MDLFAPTLSMPAHRMLQVQIAREGDFLYAFDIDCAFLHAQLTQDEQINILLPPEWREENEKPVKRLLKALYGLPQAPQRWYQHYAGVLRTLGWEVCGHEKAMWRRPSSAVPGKYLKLSIYVDDNVMGGPDKQETEKEMNRILTKLAGRVIKPTIGRGGLTWDCLGADLTYNRNSNSMKPVSYTHLTLPTTPYV